MKYIANPHSNSNPVDRSVDQTNACSLNRVAFATALAQDAFRGAYTPPAHAGFVDRTPGELAIIWATMWPGAAR